MLLLGHLTDVVIEDSGFNGSLSVKEFRKWLNQLKKYGGFMEYMRGKWKRQSILDLFLSMERNPKKYDKSHQYSTTKIVSRYVTTKTQKS